MNFRDSINQNEFILMEGALGERLKREYGIVFDEQIAMAGLIYEEKGALSEQEALEIHKWTVEQFYKAGVDFLYAGIMPTLSEAAGLARAVDDTGLPYIISFTIQEDGKLIDGTTIADAIRYIDRVTTNKPVCYMTNCVHPSIVCKALARPFNQNETVKERFLGIQANTSPLSYAELDGAEELHCSEPEDFGLEMIKLQSVADIKVWGGCYGTDHRHMECLARKLKGIKTMKTLRLSG